MAHNNPPPCYWTSVGAAFAPREGGVVELVTVLPTVVFTKHPSRFVEVLSFSRNTAAKPSIAIVQFPVHPLKLTAGTSTRHGSPAGISAGFPPLEHGSTAGVGQLFILASKACFT